MSDALAVVSWWLVIQILGLAVWPLAFRWLRWLPDRGYMLSKPLGLLIISYGVWLLANFGIVQNTSGGMIAVLIGVAVIGLVVYRRDRTAPANDAGRTTNTGLIDWLKNHLTLVVAYELLFLIAFVGWSIFRAHNPDLSTTEKPMEFAFFNAIGRSATFPPHDPWLAGYSIAYYYFGYGMMSVLHQLSGVTAGMAFSLSNSMWFALAAASAFGIVANLIMLSARRTKRAAIIFGSIGAIMLVLMGNLEGALELAHANNIGSAEVWQRLDILDINGPPVQNPPSIPFYQLRGGSWWGFGWRASRVIHDYPPDAISPQLATVVNQPPSDNSTYQELIDEFPQFSFLLGDMHPHVLSLPFALLCMALALNLHLGASSGELKSLTSTSMWPLYALAVGGMSFLNTWDFPIYACVLAAALLLGRWRADRFIFWEGAADLLILALVGILLYLPFYRGLTSQARGIAPNLFNGTHASQFFIMFGPLIVIGLMFGLTILIESIRSRRVRLIPFAIKSVGGAIGLTAIGSIGAAALGALVIGISPAARDWYQGVVDAMAKNGITPTDQLLARLIDPWVPLGLALGLVAIILFWRARHAERFSESAGALDQSSSSGVDFVLLLFAVGLLLTFVVEFLFVIDGFGTRMNTVFKLYYQTWAMWSVAAAFGLYYLLHESKALNSVVRVLMGALGGIVLVAGLVYPLLAIPAKMDASTPTLDAVQSMAVSIPDEYAAIDWLNRFAPDTAIILEAPGDEYNAGTSRVSTWTGLSTVVGWAGHEGQWRGNCEIQCPRVDEVKNIYSTSNSETAFTLLNKYHVSYVYVGPNERRLYAPASLSKFDQLLPTVFRQGLVVIYQVPTKVTSDK